MDSDLKRRDERVSRLDKDGDLSVEERIGSEKMKGRGKETRRRASDEEEGQMKNDGDGRDLERGRSKRNGRVESRGDEDNGRECKDRERKRSRRSNMDEDFRGEIRDRRRRNSDETETNLVNLTRTIYVTIMSTLDYKEAGHKLQKIKLEPGQEMELCIMILECCLRETTYLRYYGLLGQQFCMINKIYQENFETCFKQQYSMIDLLGTNKLCNVAMFFAHLLGTDALPWHVLAYIRLTEEDTTSSSRIFIKILFEELSEHLGIRRMNERLSDPTMQDSFESIFPQDNVKNMSFSINFFTSIGLGGITENLRKHLS